ncbi:MAG: glycine--tRNA ligase subunit beta, partial [Mariprofundaceae bacterium]|nr:glycine--tRNA ligase subunit beta [Mariprofundaceae bacterium]
VTPRRLLLHITRCPVMQEDREETIWGPPEKVAFDEKGNPTRAAEGFAKKSGLSINDFELADKGDGKALYMKAVKLVKGRNIADIIAEAMPDILRKLPSPKQMQWQDGENRADAYIRPIRWIVACLGADLIPFSFAGVESGKISQGHRIHGSSGEIDVNDPFKWLESQFVTADRDVRKALIASQLQEAAAAKGVDLIEDDALLDEVTDLVEWPKAIAARFDEGFLRLPIEVIRIELKHHQRCFTAKTATGECSNIFFAIANIESKDPEAVARGNERVVNARLADAAFYFDRDPKKSLEARAESLNEVVFQEGLGMVGDQIRRMRGFVLDNATHLGVDANEAQRAAYLCKSDLTTGLVGEFPELQGYMGGIYAEMDGETAGVAKAIAEHYAPAGADDALPESAIARAIGIAERADKLLGYFHLGRIPTATTDPFGLRRAAITLVRLLSDEKNPVNMTLPQILEEAGKQWGQQRVTITTSEETHEAAFNFIRGRHLGIAKTFGISRSALDAVMGAKVRLPIYRGVIIARLFTGFADSETGEAVTAANKRIANILKKAGDVSTEIDESLLVEGAEKALFKALNSAEASFPEEPEEQLSVLADLREPIDTFFDDVMVMIEDEAVRNNRLALLTRLRGLFLQLADFSRL